MLQGTGGFPGLPHPGARKPGWRASADLCELSSCGAELMTEWRGWDAAGTVRFGALLAGGFKPGMKQGSLDLSDGFPYRELVCSLLHCCPF